MKAIKIASGVAITALAAAISAQAYAEAETTVEWTGSVRVQTVIDLEGDTSYSNQLPGYAAGDEDWYHLDSETKVTHGPFSGTLSIGLKADEDDNNAGAFAGGASPNGQVRVDDLRVDEGPISFGQVGSIADTVGKLEGLTDFYGSDEVGLDDGLGVEAAFRYTLEDFGLRIQGEGEDTTDFGFAAAIHQDFDVAQIWADFQYREPVGGDDNTDAITGFGVAVEASPIDMLTLEAAFRNNSDADDSAWGVKATVNVTETISVYGQLASSSMDADELGYRVGGSAGFAPVTVEGWFSQDLTDGNDDSGRVFAKVSYAEGPWGAYAETEVGLNDGEGVQFELGGNYTTESGIKYGAEYANGDAGDEDSEASVATLFAQYSF